MTAFYRNGLTPYHTSPYLGLDLVPHNNGRRSRDSIYSRLTRDERYDLFDDDQYERRRRRHYDSDNPAADLVRDLHDRTLKGGGDLGWTLEYAAAYCYKHLNGNRPGIINTINSVRKAPVAKHTPFMIFDCLDRNLFVHKLKGMVHLKWKCLPEDSPGVTSAPGVISPRITIELNSSTFVGHKGEIDDLLEMLIHQMIHAFFLVCCGAQEKGAKQDGRLLDALHFGVVLSSINDLTKECRRGSLRMTFHPSNRLGSFSLSRRSVYAQRHDFISIDPHGSAIGPPPADSRSHCTHDNRQFSRAHLKNWQVEEYARCIDLGMEAKGDVVCNLNSDGKLEETKRLEGPPSCTYVELIWDEKRVMASRDKAMAFASLKKPLTKEGKFELKVPKCDQKVFKCLFDFIQHSKYLADVEEIISDRYAPSRRRKGPPIITGQPGYDNPASSIINNICVFKMAESIKFEELEKYALQRLYNTLATSDDPILALQELYNDKESEKPIHSELHKWARKFLVQTDGEQDGHTPSDHHRGISRGISNYEKLLTYHRERFEEFYHRNIALKDDCKLVAAELLYAGRLDDKTVLNLSDTSCSSLTRTINPIPYRRRLLDTGDLLDSRRAILATRSSLLDTRRQRSLLDPLEVRIRSRSPSLSVATDRLHRLRLTDELPSLGLQEVSSPPCYHDYLSRSSGRRRRVDSLTGERFLRGRERWRDGKYA